MTHLHYFPGCLALILLNCILFYFLVRSAFEVLKLQKQYPKLTRIGARVLNRIDFDYYKGLSIFLSILFLISLFTLINLLFHAKN